MTFSCTFTSSKIRIPTPTSGYSDFADSSSRAITKELSIWQSREQSPKPSITWWCRSVPTWSLDTAQWELANLPRGRKKWLKRGSVTVLTVRVVLLCHVLVISTRPQYVDRNIMLPPWMVTAGYVHPGSIQRLLDFSSTQLQWGCMHVMSLWSCKEGSRCGALELTNTGDDWALKSPPERERTGKGEVVWET